MIRPLDITAAPCTKAMVNPPSQLSAHPSTWENSLRGSQAPAHHTPGTRENGPSGTRPHRLCRGSETSDNRDARHTEENTLAPPRLPIRQRRPADHGAAGKLTGAGETRACGSPTGPPTRQAQGHGPEPHPACRKRILHTSPRMQKTHHPRRHEKQRAPPLNYLPTQSPRRGEKRQPAAGATKGLNTPRARGAGEAVTGGGEQCLIASESDADRGHPRMYGEQPG